MASIKDTADRQVTAGKWKSVDVDANGAEVKVRKVYHYSTEMLTFVLDKDGQWDGELDFVDYSTGHGSVSDQNGMNVLFARLGMPYYYQRRDVASIVTLDDPNYSHRTTDRSKHGWRRIRNIPGSASWYYHTGDPSYLRLTDGSLT